LCQEKSGNPVFLRQEIRPDDDSEDSGVKSRRGSVTNGSVTNVASASQSPQIECVSSRILRLNFSPIRGLHYHLPVLVPFSDLSFAHCLSLPYDKTHQQLCI
jgi:hypothetical protein